MCIRSAGASRRSRPAPFPFPRSRAIREDILQLCADARAFLTTLTTGPSARLPREADRDCAPQEAQR
jgi:hypothetical protein